MNLTNPHKALLYSERDDSKLGPVSVHFHPTNFCNHNCKFTEKSRCEPLQFRHEFKEGWEVEESLKLIETLDRYQTENIQFSGGGEPLMNRGIDKMVSYALTKNFKGFGLVSNGYLLDKYMDLFLKRFSLRISVNGFSKEEHSRVHQVDEKQYGKILENLKSFVEKKKDSSKLGIGMIISYKNDLSKLLDWLAIMIEYVGADFISIRPAYSNQDRNENTKIRNFLLENQNIFDEAKNRFGDKLWYGTDRMEGVYSHTSFTRCHASKLHATITANQGLYVCCNLLHPLGNLRTSSFEELWFTRRLQYLETLKPHTDPKCSRCVMSQYNRVLEEFSKAKKEPAFSIF